MRTLKMAFAGGLAGALMAGNVAPLQAAPLPTNVASMKSMVADSAIQIRWRCVAAAGDTEVSEAGVIEVGVGEQARLLVP